MAAKQSFSPRPGESLKILGEEYIFQPHPKVKYIAYASEAGRATVYQVKRRKGDYFALKIFKKKFRSSTLVDSAQHLSSIETFEGLRAAKRHIILPADGITRIHSSLEYAIIMPWISGETWFDILIKARNGFHFQQDHSLRVCKRFLEVMQGIESAGMAHTDISPGNVMIEPRSADVQLLDLEDIYMPNIESPKVPNKGSKGYRHHRSDLGESCWKASGDRYAVAVLAAEILVFANPVLVRKATDEGFFTNHCKSPQGLSRFKEAELWLKKISPEFFPVFEQSWLADSLEQCPKVCEIYDSIKKTSNNQSEYVNKGIVYEIPNLRKHPDIDLIWNRPPTPAQQTQKQKRTTTVPPQNTGAFVQWGEDYTQHDGESPIKQAPPHVQPQHPIVPSISSNPASNSNIWIAVGVVGLILLILIMLFTKG